MDNKFSVYAPIELAELLHATLGPLGDVLEKENHHWAAIVRRVLLEYIRERNGFISDTYGSNAIPHVNHLTFLASERVCRVTDLAIAEEIDFAQWAGEVEEGA